MVYVESGFIVERTNANIVTQATFTQLAVASGMGSKPAHKLFVKQIKNLTG